MSVRTGLLVVIAVLASVNVAKAQMDVFLNFDSDWETGLDLLATSAGVTSFSGAERATIQSNIESELNTMFADQLLTFHTTSPGGSFTTIDYGATSGSSGVLGFAPLDYFNVNPNQTASVITANFGFILNEFSGTSSRATQIDQISKALAGTGGHELGHSIGLSHYHAYGTESITPANYADTEGAQNNHIIATGSTGLGEIGRETSRSLSQWSTFMTETTGGLLAGLHGTTGTALTATTIFEENFFSGGDVGDTVGTAGALTDVLAPLSGYEHSGHAFSDLGFAGATDLFALTIDAPGTITAEIVSVNRWASSFDSLLEIFDTDGTTLLASNDDAIYSGDTYGSGGFGSTDSFLINVFADAPGTYYLRVSASDGTETGAYSLLYGANVIPEPGSMAVLLLIGAGLAFRRRR